MSSHGDLKCALLFSLKNDILFSHTVSTLISDLKLIIGQLKGTKAKSLPHCIHYIDWAFLNVGKILHCMGIVYIIIWKYITIHWLLYALVRIMKLTTVKPCYNELEQFEFILKNSLWWNLNGIGFGFSIL